MEKEVRNRIQRATQAARQLLEEEYREQLEGAFDILLDGSIAEKPGSHLSPEQCVVRGKLVAVVAHKRASGLGPDEAVAAYLREAAFTVLNRLVALKMLEARGLVQECVSKGEESSGFREFTALASGLGALPDKGYRLYIESLFDEIGREVRILFDRRDVASLLWPRRQALHHLMAILNDTDLHAVWAEDETIGWVYQYFNSDDERKQMREASPVPRNSREVAVRNQFFTPHYVVRFLTANTLGRLWYEMRQGNTELRELEYFVRWPNEVFQAEDEKPPSASKTSCSKESNEQLLNEPAHIAYRPKKDPRDLNILDPACGSGHFLLFAFNLLTIIYEEAWADPTSPPSQVTGRALRLDFPDLHALRLAVPGLILEHNLYGVEIDPRCAQIAALALWMRTQKAFREAGPGSASQPVIRRTNIVVAEPMPGDRVLQESFLSTLDPRLSKLTERIFTLLELAGEAGSLLPIEKAINAEAREVYGEHGDLFRSADEELWSRAEQQVLDSLREYSGQATDGKEFERRLFAEDATRAIGFIDVCQRSYDVVLMNPPFGDASEQTAQLLNTSYANWAGNLACAFVSRARELSGCGGIVGAILDNSINIRSSYKAFRETEWFTDGLITLAAVLGWGVLDAYVETSAIVQFHDSCGMSLVFGADLSGVPPDEKAGVLSTSCNSAREGDVHLVPRQQFSSLPNSVLDLGWPEFLVELFFRCQSLEESGLPSYQGHALEAARHYRLFWELHPDTNLSGVGDWVFAFKGGEYSPCYLPESHVALVGPQYSLVPEKSSNVLRNKPLHFKRGVGYGKRGEFVDAQPFPAGMIFTHEGMAFVPDSDDDVWYLLGLINSDLFNFGINKYCGQHKQSGYVNLFPALPVELRGDQELRESVQAIVGLKTKWARLVEPHREYGGPAVLLPEIAHHLDDLAAKTDSLYTQDLNHLRWHWDRLNVAIFRLYEIPSDGRAAVADYCGRRPALGLRAWRDSTPLGRKSQLLEEAILAILGCVFGRYSLGPGTDVNQLNANQAVPFNQRCHLEGSPAQLCDGHQILVADHGHEADIDRNVSNSGRAVFGERWPELVSQFCRLCGFDTLTDFLWHPEGAFSSHLTQYSVGNRKAPIYWQLATPSTSYSVYLYYHRFTQDTFFKVLNDFVAPKVQHEERKLTELVQDAGPNPSARQRKEIDDQDGFVEELRVFSNEVARIAPLWNPNLNDGVLINFAPLWRLVPQHRQWQKECKVCWDKLVAGDYDWSQLAMHLWPERVVPKCGEDRSLAIAHDLEGIFWIEDGDGKWQPRSIQPSAVEALIRERTSPAVKGALNDLLSAPVQAAAKKAARRSVRKQGVKTAPSFSSRTQTPVRQRPTKEEPQVQAAGIAQEETLSYVREAIASIAGGASKSDVLASTGLSESDWNRAIQTLLQRGDVTRTGAKRGTRYHIVPGERS